MNAAERLTKCRVENHILPPRKASARRKHLRKIPDLDEHFDRSFALCRNGREISTLKRKEKNNEPTKLLQQNTHPVAAHRTRADRRLVYAYACGRKPWVRSYND